MKALKAMILSACIMLLAMFTATPAPAATIDLNVLGVGVWDTFFFGGVGSSASNDYTFTVGSGMSFYVTDSYCFGDQFSTTLGNTSLAAYSPCGSSGEIAPYGSQALMQASYDLGTYSRGEFVLSPGTYNVYITALLSPHGGGGAFAKLDTATAVPEPSTLLLLGSGMVGLALTGIRKFRKNA